jgi:hypothetical protein
MLSTALALRHFIILTHSAISFLNYYISAYNDGDTTAERQKTLVQYQGSMKLGGISSIRYDRRTPRRCTVGNLRRLQVLTEEKL